MASAPEATGLAVVEMAQAGRFAEIRDLFAPNLATMVSAEALKAGWEAELARRGPVSSVGTPVSEPAGPAGTVVKVPVTCKGGGLTVVVSVDQAGQLAGLQLAPASSSQPATPWKPPPYANPQSFDEQEVIVGSGPLTVAGTLSLPQSSGPLPAAVLLGGSGPQDRDETIGANKPLRDVAWGLASRGIAVLRFDKVTHAHPNEVRRASHFTLADEYLPQAAAAVGLLREHESVDAGRINLLGHSLGGTVAPRVAAAQPSVAGLVILAGGAQPLHWATVRQVRYLASLRPETAATSQPALDALTQQAELVDSADLSPSTPASQLPFGVPAQYWLDLRDYDPVGVAASLGKPMLILQGGRDYQVTVDDDLARWKTGLAGRPDVTFRVFPPDNHLFFPGSGPSTPAEYEPAQHLDPAVIYAIASWLGGRAGPSED